MTSVTWDCPGRAGRGGGGRGGFTFTVSMSLVSSVSLTPLKCPYVRSTLMRAILSFLGGGGGAYAKSSWTHPHSGHIDSGGRGLGAPPMHMISDASPAA